MSCYGTVADFYSFGIRASALDIGVTDAIILSAMEAASSVADGYLNARYTLPLVTWSQDVIQKVCAIAAFEVMSSQNGFNPDSGNNMTIVERKQDAIRWLEGITATKVSPLVGESAPVYVSRARVFSDRRRGW